MTFESSIEAVRQSLTKDDPVVIARWDLEPTRKAAVFGLDEFNLLVSRLRPAFDDASVMLEKARAIGVWNGELYKYVQEGFRIMLGGGAALFTDLVSKIDNLTALVLAQEPHLIVRYQGRLREARENIGYLERLSEKVKIHVAELQQQVKNAVPNPQVDPQVVPQAQGMRRSEVSIETQFDPRT